MKITKSRISYYERIKDGIDEHIDDIFSVYREFYPKWKYWGVDKWNIYAGKLCLSLTTSCRGCSDWDEISFPEEWLYMSSEDYRKAIQDIWDKDNAEAAKIRKIKEAEAEAKELLEFERLKEKYGQ